MCSLSGGDDGFHGNQTIMEDTFNSGNATWEITRYSGVEHGFTVFGGDAYDLVADARSWESMMSNLEELLATPQMVGDDGNSMPETDDDDTGADSDSDNESSGVCQFTVMVSGLSIFILSMLAL